MKKIALFLKGMVVGIANIIPGVSGGTMAVVTNTYKMALDSYFSGDYKYDPAWYRELESVTHRDYATGYYFSDCRSDANLAKNNGYMKEKSYLAVVVSYDENSGTALLSQRNKMNSYDKIELLTPGRVGVPIDVGELFDEELNPIEATSHPYMNFYMKVPFPVKTGDIIRLGG